MKLEQNSRWLVWIAVLLASGCASVQPMADKGPPAAAVPANPNVLETTSFADLEPLLASLPADDTLLVLDIDDTLLTSPIFFGSDHWYEWQKGLKPANRDWVPCKFDWIGFHTEVGTQSRTEPGVPEIVNRIGLPRLQLTSRNPNYRGGTERELKAAGYAVLPPLSPAQPRLRIEWPQPGSGFFADYQNGIFMTRGADKGLILLKLLEELGLNYGHIVLVDDGRKNIDNMQAALQAKGIEYHGVWYRKVSKGEPDRVQVRAARKSWAAWQRLLRQNYPERLRRIEAARSDEKQCAN